MKFLWEKVRGQKRFIKFSSIKAIGDEIFDSARNYCHNFICGDYDGHGDAYF